MALFGDDRPIVAVSTGLKDKNALGIVRISGFKNLNFLSQLTRKKGTPEARKAYFSKFYGSEEVLDEGIYTYFEGPKSFTGENVIEFNLHGNPLILRKFTEYLIKSFDFREALPGEFSYRALKNKKLNLTQVEGLDLLLNANSSFGLSSGTKLLNNDLYKDYEELRETFKEIKTTIELLIDFAEDVGEEEAWEKFEREILKFGQLINPLFKRANADIDKLLSPSIVLVGPTNAGKSTLFNKLVGENRAIVSDIHGTTRDFISEYISINGDSFKLIDTAGLRDTKEHVEKEGIERGLKIFNSAFYKVFVCNPFNELDFDYHQESLNHCDAILFTHSDKKGFNDAFKGILENMPKKVIFKSGPIGAVQMGGPMGAKHETGSIGPDSESGPMGAKSETGSIGPDSDSGPMGATLENVISGTYKAMTAENPIPIDRHRHEISGIYRTYNELLNTYKGTQDAAILSSLSNRLGSSLDQLVGIVSPQEVLDHIFTNFCIGK